MDLFTTALELGIQTEFIDAQGRRRVTEPAALEVILGALPPRAGYRFVDGPVVLRSAVPSQTRFGDAATSPLRWKIVADLKVIAEGTTAGRTMDWPLDLPVGSYRLQLSDATGAREQVPLLVAPPRAFGGEFERCWLMAVQLYGLK